MSCYRKRSVGLFQFPRLLVFLTGTRLYCSPVEEVAALELRRITSLQRAQSKIVKPLHDLSGRRIQLIPGGATASRTQNDVSAAGVEQGAAAFEKQKHAHDEAEVLPVNSLYRRTSVDREVVDHDLDGVEDQEAGKGRQHGGGASSYLKTGSSNKVLASHQKKIAHDLATSTASSTLARKAEKHEVFLQELQDNEPQETEESGEVVEEQLRETLNATERAAYLQTFYDLEFDFYDGLGPRRYIFPLEESESDLPGNPCKESDIESPVVLSGMSTVHVAGQNAGFGGDAMANENDKIPPNAQPYLDGKSNTDHRICFGGNANKTQTGHFRLPRIGGHGVQQITLRHRGGNRANITCNYEGKADCLESPWGATKQGTISAWITMGEGKNAIAPFEAKEDRMAKSGWGAKDVDMGYLVEDDGGTYPSTKN